MSGLIQSLQSGNSLPSLNVATGLPAVLTGTASDLSVARSLLAICAVLVVLLAAASSAPGGPAADRPAGR